MVHETVGDDKSFYFTCSSGHKQITSPRYDSRAKAQDEYNKHKARMGCK